MKLHAPGPTPQCALVDIHSEPIIVGNGRKMLRSLFREATCCGRDAGDHIPIERLELFVARGIAARAALA